MHRQFLIPFIFCCALGFSQVGERGGRGSDVREEVTGEKRALIIGISEYQNEDLNLKVADDDAQLFKNYLTNIEKVSDQNIIYLENEQASAQAIYQGIDELIKVTQEGDEVYIYFAGHGDVVNRENEKVGFLLAHDVNGGRNYRGTDGVVALSALNEFVNQLTTTGANVVMALDACHSGFIYEEGAKTNMNTLSDGDNFVKTTKFLSCAPSQTSQEDIQLGHGYFTFYWVLGMMGAADIGAQDNQLKYSELDDFVYQEVASLTNNQQEPLVITSNRRRLFKNLIPENKEIAMLAHGKSINLKDTLQFLRSSTVVKAPKQLSNIEKQFKQLIDQWGQKASREKALELYQDANSSNELSGAQLSRMRFTLSRKLTNQSNRIINNYISGPKELPAGAEFYEESLNVRKAMELLDVDHPSYKALQVNALFLEAYSYIRNDDYQKFPLAEKLLKQAIDLEERAAYIWNALGILSNENHQFKDAATYYNKAIELIPTWVYPINNLGSNYFELLDYQKAIEIYERALEIDPNYNTSLQNLAAIAENQGYISKAEETYKELLKTDPDNSTLFTNIALIEKGKGNLKAAQSYYLQALERFPNNVDVLFKYADFLLENNISYVDPVKFLDKALELQPGYFKALTTYADFLRRNQSTPENLARADSLYNQAILNNPFYPSAYSGLGYLQHQQDNPEAVKVFEKAVAANKQSVVPLYNLAWFKRHKLNNIDTAITIHKKIITRNPYYLPSYQELTSIYQSRDNDEAAIDLVKNFISNAGENPENLLLLGNVYFQQGNKEKALEQYRRCLQLDPTHTYAAASLALSLIDEGNFEEALPFAKQAIEDNPIKYGPETFSSSLSRKARSYKRDDKNNLALSAYRLAYELDGTNTKPAFDFAQQLYFENDLKEAASVIEKANDDTKSWKEKWLILKLKIAVLEKDAAVAEKLLKEYKTLSSRVDPVLKLLVLQLKNRNKAKEFKNNINAAYLSTSRLMRSYNEATIKIISDL
ncbi:hypothetical protein AAU57_08435 [Nonlabens sp. YIK11]|uniref:tetratricopeptide repeat protein n=1 Tax=Nonlabens sp. YIK11 TaxID=1453349 RepID=UPI0006DCB682|nr:tetratricopeptide repeat protein [Nonlabens sp. YIK11]KQC33338.1 hypothetical protein AAU57_08435 [Nonlabens sp. YIK11]